MTAIEIVAPEREYNPMFRHYHMPDIPIPSVTVSIEEEPIDDKNSRYTFGYAICNPADNFSRKIGREIALKTSNTRGFSTISERDQSPRNLFEAFERSTMNSKFLSEYMPELKNAMKNHLTVDTQHEQAQEYEDRWPFEFVYRLAPRFWDRFIQLFGTTKKES